MTDWIRTAKLASDGEPIIGPNGAPMHHLLTADSLRGRAWLWRYVVLRRMSQITILLLFFGTAHWGWNIGDKPVLVGNLSGSEFVGFLPMADPFAALQILLTQHLLETEVIVGALIIALFYGAIVGRAFCAWVCPINIFTDLANWLRRKWDIKDSFPLSRNTRYLVLGLALVLSVLSGVAAFEWVSPISMLHRELIFGLGIGWMAVLGVFIFDLFVLKNGWCGHLCPLGAFYALLGSRTAQIKVRFDAETCTHCGECATVCPEPQVLNLKKTAAAGMVASGECTNCGRCTPVCPERSLRFDLRLSISRSNSTNADPRIQRTI